ncbi:T9SS type A sorting domain-containing protein [Hymenobacter taeanensis]|uniref:T9SS type A sorting domain-containing protein n=1 Tax=Hymenobacter taeanensis TaxID=2735321 RepID=A0A6M6BG09_9BACT|nr:MULTISPECIES: T9SS type A sorting domain-containing protein [Hymenobacter]QJX46173.1 T9SS type A sorting domain-containing protein [Hymenobacter taeanensis]UOQ80029.1 T9SS type A sorting domain-containing protein [Hymenobacter sp. 5414T-23]
MRTSAFLGLPLLVLLGCESPSTTFDAFHIRHPQNLEKVLGSRLHLVSARDTLDLQVQYNPVSKRNIITRSGTPDTLLNAWAFRYKQLYYVVQPNNGTAYWVHAMRIRGNEVQGLATGWEQMLDLSEAVKQGGFSGLVRYQSLTRDSSRLQFDVRQLRDFYTTEIDSFTVYRVATAAVRHPPSDTQEAPVLYPNPAQHYTTVRFPEPGKRTVQLFTPTGQCVYRIETVAHTLTLPLSQLPVGQYTVRADGLRGQKASALHLLISR